MNDVVEHFKFSNGGLLGIQSDNVSSNYPITCKLPSALESSEMQRPVLRNHIPGMAHAIQLISGIFMSSREVKVGREAWEAHEHG